MKDRGKEENIIIEGRITKPKPKSKTTTFPDERQQKIWEFLMRRKEKEEEGNSKIEEVVKAQDNNTTGG